VGRTELELKGVVSDPDATRRALVAAGGRLTYQGFMTDTRFDRNGEFTARDEVVRLRVYAPYQDRPFLFQLGWKGPTRRSPEGFKEREERELDTSGGDPASFLGALGFVEVHAIDRFIEMYEVAGGIARLEWYPRMDVLIEVEGEPAAIEAMIRATGLPRDGFTSEALTAFTTRYDARHPDAPSLIDTKRFTPDEKHGWSVSWR
jgi:adenylate cyclase class IV